MLTKDNSLRKAFMHLKMAEEYFADTIREVPNSLAGKASKEYRRRIQWILKDFKSSINMPGYALEEFGDEMNGDILFHEVISRKSLQLNAQQKEIIETLIDELLNGEEITVEAKN